MTVHVMTDRATLQTLADRLAPLVREREPLAHHAYFRIGGPADLFLAATEPAHVALALSASRECGVPCRLIGSASNLLVSDDGVDGLVVKVLLRGVRYERRVDEPNAFTIVAAAGVQLASLARESARRGYEGLVWASSVPGTVGAAVVNNAGAFGGCMADVLERAHVVDADGVTSWLTREALAMSYRTTRLKRGELALAVLEAELRVRHGDSQALTAEVHQIREQRRQTQPAGFSAGSMFTNPPADAAGRLIEAAGLKGRRSGAAEISTLHANFFLNHGGAKARDVYTLMRAAQDAVFRQSGIWLHPEVELIGRWSAEDLNALTAPARRSAGG
jgi:UDP-N-acetylmuramate dehydrogenase